MKVEGKTAKPSKSKATKRSHEKAFFLAFSTQRIGGQRTPFKPMRGFRWLQIASLGGLKKKEEENRRRPCFCLFIAPLMRYLYIPISPLKCPLRKRSIDCFS